MMFQMFIKHALSLTSPMASRREKKPYHYKCARLGNKNPEKKEGR